MKRIVPLIFVSFIFNSSCINGQNKTAVILKCNDFSIGISENGAITELKDPSNNKNYLLSDTSSYIMSVRRDNAYLFPHSVSNNEDILTLYFSKDIEARIKTEEKDSYITFELLSISHIDSIELILWGPYHTTIREIIGETVGVVRNNNYAIGIQALNIKTLGGYPWNESDRMPAFEIYDQEDPENMHPDTDGSVLYRIEAAKPTRKGSSLQAYCRNRGMERIVEDFGHEKLIAPAYDDGGVIGSRIALFGCPEEEVLKIIGEIELTEDLPHPVIDGEWGKTNPGASAAYIITNFTESNIDRAIGITKKAGLKYLYHYGKTFENWGHFDLYKGEFPNGIEGLKSCVEKAESQGIKIGTHFLSNFITTNDPYVTPVPDNRLAKVGSSVITADIDATAREISIQSPDFFKQMKNNNLKTVVIGNELIRYGNVTNEAPYILLDCQRGAFNTSASVHKEGDTISKLLDHAYRVFLTNADLTIEMSERIADIYNITGMRQISFDGLEGNRSTGLGTYGESLMPYTWYNNLSDELKNHLIIDASRETHFFWHIYTRMNWGEPWYGGFRESQTEYRFKNQAYFRRNYMPGMLGWFKMTPQTSLEDIEWLLARSAGYDAGYAFVADMDVIEKNGISELILEQLGLWERLRIGGHFTEAQKNNLRNTDLEFSLKQISENEWRLQYIEKNIFQHEKKEMQPGEPLISNFKFNNNGISQAMNFILRANDCDVEDIMIEIDNYRSIQIPGKLKNGQAIKQGSNESFAIYNENWNSIQEMSSELNEFELSPGEHSISISCNFNNSEENPNLLLEVRMVIKEETISLKNE
jgi:hypothetical protein